MEWYYFFAYHFENFRNDKQKNNTIPFMQATKYIFSAFSFITPVQAQQLPQ